MSNKPKLTEFFWGKMFWLGSKKRGRGAIHLPRFTTTDKREEKKLLNFWVLWRNMLCLHLKARAPFTLLSFFSSFLGWKLI